MTNDELRQKLKHIGGLLFAVAVDIGNHEDELKALRTRVHELEALTASPPYKKRQRIVTDEQRERQRQRMKEYWAQKNAEKEKNY